MTSVQNFVCLAMLVVTGCESQAMYSDPKIVDVIRNYKPDEMFKNTVNVSVAFWIESSNADSDSGHHKLSLHSTWYDPSLQFSGLDPIVIEKDLGNRLWNPALSLVNAKKFTILSTPREAVTYTLTPSGKVSETIRGFVDGATLLVTDSKSQSMYSDPKISEILLRYDSAEIFKSTVNVSVAFWMESSSVDQNSGQHKLSLHLTWHDPGLAFSGSDPIVIEKGFESRLWTPALSLTNAKKFTILSTPREAVTYTLTPSGKVSETIRGFVDADCWQDGNWRSGKFRCSLEVQSLVHPKARMILEEHKGEFGSHGPKNSNKVHEGQSITEKEKHPSSISKHLKHQKKKNMQ